MSLQILLTVVLLFPSLEKSPTVITTKTTIQKSLSFIDHLPYTRECFKCFSQWYFISFSQSSYEMGAVISLTVKETEAQKANLPRSREARSEPGSWTPKLSSLPPHGHFKGQSIKNSILFQDFNLEEGKSSQGTWLIFRVFLTCFSSSTGIYTLEIPRLRFQTISIKRIVIFLLVEGLAFNL